MNTNSEFTPLSFLKVRLLKEPIYRKDSEDWEQLRVDQEKIEHYFRQIGLELVRDDAEGFAFLRQIEVEGLDRVPRLTQRRQLSYVATLLLVCLREEFCRFDTSSPDEVKLTKTDGELQDLVASYLTESTNEVRDLGKLSTAIGKLEDLGFLEKISSDPDTYEVKPIVKAKVGPAQLEEIKKRLQEYANIDTNNEA